MEESFVIQSSECGHLRNKADEINKFFNVTVHLQADPNCDANEGIQWITVKGTESGNVVDAKKHIIALCNPELKEHISFPGFPLYIFAAFKELIKLKIQREFGVVLSVTEDGFIDISGTNIGVTLAISKIHHLHKLSRDKERDKARHEALYFDVYINKIGDSYQGKLKDLSNVLKKEILNILDVTIQPANGETVPKVPKPTKTEPEVICLDDSVQEESIEVISSSEDDSSSEREEDSEEDIVVKRVENDGTDGTVSYILPPNFVIKEWIRVNYEGTNNTADFVNKNDMLQHFRMHFDLPDHPDLANTFFDKLAVRIFPLDPNYRCVKTKKTKSKQGKRRLICLRRRTVSNGSGSSFVALETPRQDASPPRQGAISPPHQPPPKAASPPRQNPQLFRPPHPSSTMMKDWNSNRPGTIKPPTDTRPPQPSHPSIEQWHTVPVPGRPVDAGLDVWLNSAPRPKPRTRPAVQRQSSAVINSLAKRVSEMSNDQLIKKPRPPFNPNLRHIIIDGSNVAMSHGNNSKFSCRGIALCARFFIERGHKDVTCFVPNYRKGGGGNPPSNDHYLLIQLEEMGILKPTPSRRVGGQNIVCYDDRFIVELAGATNGVILSNDQYRDLMAQNIKWRPIVEQQLLQFTIVGDLLMLPEDPLGRDGPSLEDFLMKPRNGMSRPPPKMVRVPAPVRPKQASLQRPPTNNTKPPLLPTPRGPYSPSPPPRQAVPSVPNAWLPQRNFPVVLSPDQQRLAYQMLQILPAEKAAIEKVISDHPGINNIQHLMDILLISETGT